MEVGIIAPIKRLESYCITNTQYVLPGLLWESGEYREFYEERARQGDRIIVDCIKPNWRRQPEELHKIKDTLSRLEKANVIVVTPSKMFNWESTLNTAQSYMEALGNWTYAGCLEGITSEDVVQCRSTLAGEVSMYAVPAHMISIVELPDEKVVWVDNYKKVEEIEDTEGIIVTSLPVRLGLRGQLLSAYLPSPPELNFYHEDFTWDKMVERNIKDTIRFYK